MDLCIADLEYLHDATLHEVKLDFQSDRRDFRFIASYHSNCGVERLVGLTIQVTLEDVSRLDCQLFGDIHGQETIDFCEVRVHPKHDENDSASVDSLQRTSNFQLSLVSHSGSEWVLLFTNRDKAKIEQRPLL